MKLPLATHTRTRGLRLSFAYWLIVLTQIPATALFFRTSQELATAVYGAVDVAMLFYLLAQVQFRFAEGLHLGSNAVRAVYVYLLWCLGSVFWSVSDSSVYGVALIGRDLIRVIDCSLMILLLGGQLSRSIFLRAAVIAAIIHSGVVLTTMDVTVDFAGAERSAYSDYKDGVGIARQSGILCLLAIAAVDSGVTSPIRGLASVLACLVLMFITFSKMGLAALALAFYAGYVLYRSSMGKLLWGSFAIASLATVIYVFRSEYILNYFDSSVGETASGRTLIWERLSDLVEVRLWVGYGLNSVYSILDGFFYKTPSTAHNEILQQLVSYGVVGFLLWVVVFIGYVSVLLNARNYSMQKLMIAFLVFFVVLGLTESSLVLSLFPVYYIVFFIAMSRKLPNRLQVRGVRNGG